MDAVVWFHRSLVVISEQSSDSLDSEGMKQAVFDQHVNLAIVSGLASEFHDTFGNGTFR